MHSQVQQLGHAIKIGKQSMKGFLLGKQCDLPCNVFQFGIAGRRIIACRLLFVIVSIAIVVSKKLCDPCASF